MPEDYSSFSLKDIFVQQLMTWFGQLDLKITGKLSYQASDGHLVVRYHGGNVYCLMFGCCYQVTWYLFI